MTKEKSKKPEEAADDLIPTSEAAEILGISTRRVTQLIKDERLPYAMKVGRSFLIRRGDLRLVEERPVGRPPNEKGEEE